MVNYPFSIIFLLVLSPFCLLPMCFVSFLSTLSEFCPRNFPPYCKLSLSVISLWVLSLICHSLWVLSFFCHFPMCFVPFLSTPSEFCPFSVISLCCHFCLSFFPFLLFPFFLSFYPNKNSQNFWPFLHSPLYPLGGRGKSRIALERLSVHISELRDFPWNQRKYCYENREVKKIKIKPKRWKMK